MTEKTPLEMVDEFNRTFETSSDPDLWKKLVLEEVKEVHEAAAHLLKELVDFTYVSAGLVLKAGEEVADEFIPSVLSEDTMLSEILEAFGPVLAEAFKRVHASNMSKVGDDGKPLRREDGKILKGPNYKPPVLDDLIVI